MKYLMMESWRCLLVDCTNELYELERVKKKNGKNILVGSAFFNWSETQRMIEFSKELYRRGYTIIYLGKGKYDFLLESLPFIREILEEDEQWYTKNRINKLLQMDKFGNAYATAEEIDSVVSAELRLMEQYKPVLVMTGYRMTLTISSRISDIPLVWCLSTVVSCMYFDKVLSVGKEQVDYKKKKNLLKNENYQKVHSLYLDILTRKRIAKSCATSGEWNKCLKMHQKKPFSCDMDLFVGNLNLMTDAKEFFPEIEEVKGRYQFCGPIFNSEMISMPAAVKEHKAREEKNRKKVLISLGSAYVQKNLKLILDAVSELDYDFFITSFDYQEEVMYPENFHFCEKFPLIEIAEYCDACIIQGGQGTLYSVIMGKCPFLVIPAFYEQRHNAENLLKYAKCGEVLYSYQLKKENITASVQRIVEVKSYQEEIITIHKVVEKYYSVNELRAECLAADAIEGLLDG